MILAQKKNQIVNDNQMFIFLNAHKRGCYAVIKLIISKKKKGFDTK